MYTQWPLYEVHLYNPVQSCGGGVVLGCIKLTVVSIFSCYLLYCSAAQTKNISYEFIAIMSIIKVKFMAEQLHFSTFVPVQVYLIKWTYKVDCLMCVLYLIECAKQQETDDLR